VEKWNCLFFDIDVLDAVVIVALCVFLFVIGIWLAFLNWRCFYVGFVKKEDSPSWIPLLGGVCLFLGFFFFPNNPKSNYAWLAFLLDWGCLPGFVYSIYYYNAHIRK